MRFRTTLIWLAVAAGLLGVILLIQRNSAGNKPARSVGDFPEIKAASVRVVHVRPGKGVEIRAVRTNGTWRIVEPLDWAAQDLSIDQFLSALEKLAPSAFITPEEMRARPSAEHEYGFDDPKASIILDSATGRQHLLAGAMTAPGDQFFLQVVGTEGAYIVGAEFLKLIPAGVNDWRDRSLVNLNRLQFDRVSVTNSGKVFSLSRVKPGPWRLISPIKTRADQARIHDALEKIHSLRTQEFVSDDPKEDLERFGLQPPRLELCLDQGTNRVVHLQFGKSVSNIVYARRTDWPAVVTVQNEFVSDWQKPIDDFRDPFLMAATEPVDSISVAGAQPFTVSWQTNRWIIAPSNWPGDADLVKEFVAALAGIRIERYVKDVVTAPDLPPFGLQTPSQRYTVQFQTLEQATNDVVELQFGSTQDGVIFVRRADEDSVYAVALSQAQALPSEPWQLRQRRLWSFAINDVKSVTFQHGTQRRQILRAGENDWALAPGSQGIINEIAIEETMRGITQAAVDRWTAFGANRSGDFGMSDKSPLLTVELANGHLVSVTFGNSTASNGAYAMVLLDGQTWIGEFPWILCRDIMAHLAPPQKGS